MNGEAVVLTAFGCVLVSGMALADALAPAAPGDVKILGRPGLLFESSLNRRVFSPFAQGPVYEEAEHAFATHWDDSDGHVGWQDEYWGKTMLCYAGALRYTRDAKLRDWCLAKAHKFIATYQRPNGCLSTCRNEDLLRRTMPRTGSPSGSDANFQISGQAESSTRLLLSIVRVILVYCQP